MNFSQERKYRTAEEWRVFWNRGAAVIAFKRFDGGEYWLDYVWPDANAVWHCKIAAAEAEKLEDFLSGLRDSQS